METLCKNINFLKDVSMIYVNFIIIVIIVSERTKEAFLLYQLLYTVIGKVVTLTHVQVLLTTRDNYTVKPLLPPHYHMTCMVKYKYFTYRYSSLNHFPLSHTCTTL